MEKNKFIKLLQRFVGPMIIGAVLALLNIWLVDNNYMEDISIIRGLYTFSSNFIGFLKWFAPFMSVVLIASGIREIRGEVLKFLGKFTVVLITSLLLIGVLTIGLSKVIVPLFVVPIEYADSPWPATYFDIHFFEYFDVFTAIIIGIVVGLIAQRSELVNKVLLKCEKFVAWVVKYVIISCSPIWIMGSFAASTYSSHGLSIVWFDLWLSLIILVTQFLWLGLMYFVLAKYSGVSFEKICRAAGRIYVIVVSMAGMTNSAIYPFLLDEQKDLGLNQDKAKFVTVSSFNMPGSLISHIVFAYGISLLFGMPIAFLPMLKYTVVLTFVLIVSPAISGGVFAITSSLLSPMLSFTDPMIALMSSMYFKQGTSNAAVNNCGDFYLTGLSMSKKEYEEENVAK